MSQWDGVPQGHRGRDYTYQRAGVRCVCRCGWRSTLAPDVTDAYRLWLVHIRQLAGRTP